MQASNFFYSIAFFCVSMLISCGSDVIEVNDEEGEKFTITLNSDNTAILRMSDDTATESMRGKSYYCSWSDYDLGYIVIFFSDKYPLIAFPNGYCRSGELYLDNNREWLYDDYSTFKAKNPGCRLKVK